MRHALTLAFLASLVSPVLTGPALADGCPTAPDNEAALTDLLDQLQDARNDMEGRFISDQMWELWLQTPDEASGEMLSRGMVARGVADFVTAYDAFDKLVNYCPFYAEGYNQRAFINYLREDYAAALPDLEEALALNPRHVAALAGKGLTLLRMGREEEGQAALRAAVALNPWLGERFLLTDPPGQEL